MCSGPEEIHFTTLVKPFEDLKLLQAHDPHLNTLPPFLFKSWKKKKQLRFQSNKLNKDEACFPLNSGFSHPWIWFKYLARNTVCLQKQIYFNLNTLALHYSVLYFASPNFFTIFKMWPQKPFRCIFKIRYACFIQFLWLQSSPRKHGMLQAS